MINYVDIADVERYGDRGRRIEDVRVHVSVQPMNVHLSITAPSGITKSYMFTREQWAKLTAVEAQK